MLRRLVAALLALGAVFPRALAAAKEVPVEGCPVAESLAVRSIDLEGLRTTHPEIVRRELVHSPGSAFSCSAWELERTRLEDLEIFADIRLRADSAGGITYAFRELPPYIPFVTLAITERDGFSMGPALASFNFLGRDIRLEAMARFGGTTEMQISASSPWLGALPVEYDLAMVRVDSYNDFEGFHEDSWRLKLDLNHRVGGNHEVLYSGELFRMDAGEAAGPRPTLGGGADLIPRLGLGYLWDGRNRRHDPRSGVYQEVRLTQNGGWLGGDADYREWLADTRVYMPWLGRNVLYAGSLYQYRTGKLGVSFPVYDRYHAGGVNTLRGFGNDALQGKSEWIGTLENRLDLYPKRVFSLWRWTGYFGIQGVAGVEAASLWGHDALMEGDVKTGVYGGLHILLAGVDRIRLEGGSNTAKLRFEGGIGILEKADIQRFRAR